MTNTYFQDHSEMIATLARDWFPIPEDAEDAAQEVMIKLALSGHHVKNAGWVYRVAENVFRDLKRKARLRQKGDEFDGAWADDVVTYDDPLAVLEREEATAAFIAGWQNLSPKLRQAMELRYQQGKSYEEIAEELGIAVGTVSSRIARAREELQV